MASAEERVERDQLIRASRALGATIPDLVKEFGLGETRIKQILRLGTPLPSQRSRDEQRELAEARREQLIQIFEETQKLAQDMPIEQASAKIGAHKATLDALTRVMEFEKALGLLPNGLAYGQFPAGLF